MSFSQATIEQVRPPRIWLGQVYLSWSASSPAGTWFQIYINQQLAWSGQRCWAWVPLPSGPVRIDIGSVETGEEQTGFTQSLPSAPSRRAKLSWQSGTYKGIDLTGFRVYGEPSPVPVLTSPRLYLISQLTLREFSPMVLVLESSMKDAGGKQPVTIPGPATHSPAELGNSRSSRTTKPEMKGVLRRPQSSSVPRPDHRHRSPVLQLDSHTVFSHSETQNSVKEDLVFPRRYSSGTHHPGR